MWGVFGVDRMYLGKWGTGILKLVTVGGFGVWGVIDLAMIMAGKMRDKQGRELLQVAEYKKFASMVLLVFAVALGIVVIINGAVAVAFVVQFMNELQNGTMPGLDALNGLNGLTPEQAQELGL